MKSTENQWVISVLKYLIHTNQIKKEAQAAVKMGYNTNYLSHIKSGKQPLSKDFVMKVHEHFKLPQELIIAEPPEENQIKRIIDQLKYEESLNAKGLAEELGIKKSSLDNLTRLADTSHIEEAVRKRYPTKYEKLIKDDIKRKLTKQDPIVSYFETKNNRFQSVGEFITISVPVVPMKAHAQYVDEFYDEAADVTFAYQAMKVKHYGKGLYMAFVIEGDSMDSGKIDDTKDGAVVLSREIGYHLWEHGLYKSKLGHIIVTNKNILFKDIIDYDKDKKEITCHSRNSSPEYSDFKLPLGYRENEIYVKQIFKVLSREMD